MEDSPTPIAELEHGPSKLEEFLDKNQKKLIILAILIFLAVIGYVIITGLAKKGAEDAGAAFMDASSEEDYNQIIKEYSNSNTAGSSAMAIAQSRTTDNDRIAALDHFIATYPDHPGIPSKLLELALIQMNADKNDDAKANLNKLLSNEKSAFLAPRAEIALADIASNNGELEEAERLYTKVRDSKAHFSHIAAERLLYLKATEPQEVKVQPAATPQAPITPSTTEFSLNPTAIPDTPTLPETPAQEESP